MDLTVILLLLDSTIRSATPLLLACLAGLYSERAGIFDIGLEGKMLAAAFFAAAVAFVTGTVWLGLLAGIGASMVLAGLHGLASITFRGNQLISGVAINFLAAGMTVTISQTWFDQGGRTPALSGPARFQSVELPGAQALEGVPILGPVYGELISGHSILVYAAFVTVPITWWLLFRTRFGLRLRAVGENPAAVDTAGISVAGLRFAAVAIAGLLCGIAGTYLSTGASAQFVNDMSGGRGYIALAALIFAKWRPWYALYACLLFGFLDALGARFQNIDVPPGPMAAALIAGAAGLLWAGRSARLDLAILGPLAAALLAVAGVLAAGGETAVNAVVGAAPWIVAAGFAIAVVAGVVTREARAPAMIGAGTAVFIAYAALHAGLAGRLADAVIPVQVMQALPYILTVVILAGFVGRAIPPRAGGEPYVKER